MCRHAAYIGPGIALTELTWDLEHSLRHQSYQARELLTGVVCADGHGITWYAPDVRTEPARYASERPIWNDTVLPAFGPVVQSGCIMAAVRNATLPGGVREANCAPFVAGRLTGSLNGYVDEWEAQWAPLVREWAREAPGPGPRGDTDGEWFLHAIQARLEVGLATAVQSVLRDAVEHARQTGTKAQLNLLVSDGEQVVASRAGSGSPQNSLYHLQDGEEFPGAHVVASEPLYDDPEWQPVPEDSVLVLRAGAPPVRLAV